MQQLDFVGADGATAMDTSLDGIDAVFGLFEPPQEVSLPDARTFANYWYDGHFSVPWLGGKRYVDWAGVSRRVRARSSRRPRRVLDVDAARVEDLMDDMGGPPLGLPLDLASSSERVGSGVEAPAGSERGTLAREHLETTHLTGDEGSTTAVALGGVCPTPAVEICSAFNQGYGTCSEGDGFEDYDTLSGGSAPKLGSDQLRAHTIGHSAFKLYNRRWLLRHGALVRWALGAAQGRRWQVVGHRRALGHVDLLLETRRRFFCPRALSNNPGGDRWPLSFWLARGWLRPRPRRTRRERWLARRRAAMRSAIRRGSGRARAAHPRARARVRDLLDALDACAEAGGAWEVAGGLFDAF